ncbi:MAG: HAD family hydrolase [Candidatus Woesearchaeota archaeon]|jgi:phosphoglycolate phosphatase-like HAD superfamily hydrolase
MSKKIIAVDLSGTLICEEAGQKAHQEWFRIMAAALNDPSVETLAKKKDYFPEVYKVLERYTGLDAKKEENKLLLKKMARSLFQMSYLGKAHQLRDKLRYSEIITLLKELKRKYTLALITTSPEESVNPILELAGCSDLFDFKELSPLHEEPNKKELLQRFISTHGKPEVYIGNEEEDYFACKELDVPFILAGWDPYVSKGLKKICLVQAKNVVELEKELTKLRII